MKNILILGGGLIGVRHARSIKEHPQANLVGVVDPNKAMHTEQNTIYFEDLNDVDAPVDGVIIATPTGLHAQNGIDCARRGWALLIEKPVAETLDQADELANALVEEGVPSLVGHHRRYHPSVQLFRKVIQSGAIGRPITTSVIWSMKKPDSYFEGNWRSTGGSPIMINLVHDLDLLRFIFGEVTEAVGLGQKHIRGSQRIESGAVALRFASGLTGTISFADTAPSPWGFEAATNENPNIASTGQDMWWTAGTEGGFSFPSLTQWGGAIDWGEAPQPTHLNAPHIHPLDAQLDHFIDVMNGETPLIDVADARGSLAAALMVENALTH